MASCNQSSCSATALLAHRQPSAWVSVRTLLVLSKGERGIDVGDVGEGGIVVDDGAFNAIARE
ncbi:MAG: hypothetical protein K0U78_05320 [Actinomycetia bacterium]|nr:hypothetical protein [Actinomycetes bacterium]